MAEVLLRAGCPCHSNSSIIQRWNRQTSDHSKWPGLTEGALLPQRRLRDAGTVNSIGHLTGTISLADVTDGSHAAPL